jgi:hypothetical protein
MYKSILVAAVAASFAFAPAAFAEKKSQAQIEHDKFCASLKATYDEVSIRAKSPKASRKTRLSLYNIKLIGKENKCAWATQA